MRPIKPFLVRRTDSVRDVIACIDENAKGIALVVDDDGHLIATVTDGDIRRAMLAGVQLSASVTQLLAPIQTPITADRSASAETIRKLMSDHGVRQIPIMDEQARPCDLALLEDFVDAKEKPPSAIVMAGGSGSRMRPLTDSLPKALLPIGGRPVMEHVIEGLRNCGIEQVVVTTHYKADAIMDHFDDGSRFGVSIDYVREDKPLGTAGALGLVHQSGPVLVMNSDILTAIDYRAMTEFHREQKADLTMAVCEYEQMIPYGVVEMNGAEIDRVVEKPAMRHFVNAGIYLLEPVATSFIPKDGPSDMTDLIQAMLEAGRRVIGFPVHEYWLDIGRPEDYKRALADVESGRI